jgi:repressor LexA
MPKYQTLTPMRIDVLNFIREYLEEHGYPPSQREIGASLGGRSTNAVAETMQRLERDGFLVSTPRVSRGIRLTGKAW